MKRALIVRGGLAVHQPKETTELIIPFLEAHNFEVRVEESPAVYADAEYMATVDLIEQTLTTGVLEEGEFTGLQSAIISGAGFAGWHGGIVASFPNTAAYMQMTGGVFVSHPGKRPEECIGDQSDYFVSHTINMTDLGRSHEITQGISDFNLVNEQYWVLHDSYMDVLATTTQKARAWDPWSEEITSPAIWTRKWGQGKIFVITCGHNVEVVLEKNVRTIIERGLLWASR